MCFHLSVSSHLSTLCCLTQRCDAVELSLVHEHVHVDGARVQLFGPQEVEDRSKQRGVSVDEDLWWNGRDTHSY